MPRRPARPVSWVYSPAVDVQARLVEVLSGEPFDRYLERHVFAPLKMKDTRYVLRRQDCLPGPQRPDVQVVNAGHPGLTEDGGANRRQIRPMRHAFQQDVYGRAR